MARAPDLIGKTFGQWTVLERTANSESGSSRWRCRCSCGTERTVLGKRLTIGLTASCGCRNAQSQSARKTTRLATGRRFGRWTVERFDSIRDRKAHWLCRCDCGAEKVVNGSNLRSGRSKSCGCEPRQTRKSVCQNN